ncbi:MAG: hypothetical protein M3460_17610 [Actinomycetota bacterium]|nr:hypothetical protein [Actinomycetota bacterium]
MEWGNKVADNEAVLVDCSTGTLIRRELSENEQLDRQHRKTEHDRVREEIEAQGRRRDQALQKLATAAGVSLTDLKDALGMGDDTVVEDPNKRKPRQDIDQGSNRPR